MGFIFFPCFWVVGLIWFWLANGGWYDFGGVVAYGLRWLWIVGRSVVEEGFDSGCIGSRWTRERERERDNNERMRFGSFEWNKKLKLEIMLSCLIFDFVFMMFGKEQWAENVESFKSALKD